MDISKKLETYIEELEAEAARCTRLAAELREAMKRSEMNGKEKPRFVIPPRAQQKLRLRHKGEQRSVRALALELIAEQGEPIHVDELVKLINERRNDPTNRAAVESQLVRAIGSGKFPVKRTAPGTFGVA